MNGCPYGLGSVVVVFNRYPALTTAALRRVLAVTAAAYFDDNATLDIEVFAGQPQRLTQWLLASMGTLPKAPKSYPLAGLRVFLEWW